MSLHPPVLCPVPEGECTDHPPADDGLRRALEEAMAEPGTNREALLLGALMSAAEYAVAAEAEGGAKLARELTRLRNRVALIRSLIGANATRCSCPGPCTACTPLTSDEQADGEFRSSRPMFEQAV